jgi:hypothetical protein
MNSPQTVRGKLSLTLVEAVIAPNALPTVT